MDSATLKKVGAFALGFLIAVVIDQKIGVSNLYGLLSPGPWSIRAAINRGAQVPNTTRVLQAAGPMVTEEVGTREEGPTQFAPGHAHGGTLEQHLPQPSRLVGR